jgi:Flagellar hook-length control protein FliK
MTIALPSGHTMETIAPIPSSRLRIPDAPPGAAPEHPQQGFAQVMARQEKSSRPKENPMGLEREETGAKIPLPPEKKAKQEGPDPATDPEVTAFLTPPISNTVLPSPPSRTGEPALDLEDSTFFLKLEAPVPNPALAAKEPIGPGSKTQTGPEDNIIKIAAPEVKPQGSLPPVDLENPTFFLKLEAPVPNPALAAKEPIGPGSKTQTGPEDNIIITSETGPASAPASVQPEEVLKENPLLSKAFEELILYPGPESLTSEQKVSLETTALAMRSSQPTTENGPSFSPQGPAISETTPLVDGPDPSPSLIFRESALQGTDSETAALEIKPDSQAPPVEELSGTEKGAAAPLLEGPPIAGAGPAKSNPKIEKVFEQAATPAASKEIPADKEISSLAKTEGLPDPEKTSPAIAGLDPKTSFLHRASGEKMGPGITLRVPGENPAGSDGPEMNNPIRFREDTPLGVIDKFPDQLRVEAVPTDRLVEGPPKSSPEWTKEALSVYQQYSKGLLRTLQQGGERIQMTLDPPQLGNILLEINRDRNFVTAHLWTDNPHTKELLDFSQGQLQKTLELDGFKLHRFEVLVQPDLKSFQDGRWFGGRQSGGDNSSPGGRRAMPEGLIPAAPESATPRFSQGNQYVDTWA